MMETLLPSRRVRAYGVAPPSLQANLWAWHLGTTLLATTYADGTWVEERAATVFPGTFPTGATSSLIPSDPLGRVGPGSLAWRTSDSSLAVWDPDGAALHTYSAEVADLVSPPVWVGDRLWWFEIEAAATTGLTPWHLRRAEADFQALTTVATHQMGGTAAAIAWEAPGGLVATPSALIGRAGWSDGGLTVSRALRQPFSGAAASEAVSSDYAALLVPGPGALSLGYRVGAPGMVAMVDDVAAEPAAHWPATGNWQIAGPFCASVAGAEASLYGFDATAVLLRAPAAATSGEPDQRIVVEPHPTAGEPLLMHLMEA